MQAQKSRHAGMGSGMRLQMELPIFAHAVLYNPAAAMPSAAAVSEPLAEAPVKAPWIALQVVSLSPSLSPFGSIQAAAF